MVATFGWSYAQISLAMTLRGVESGVMNPFMGAVADRWPARRLVFIGVIVSGLGILFLSQVNNLPTFYTSFIIIGLGGSLGMQVVPAVVISRWFRKNTGKAYGILAAGIGLSGFLVLPNSLNVSRGQQTQDVSMGVKEALKTRAFWHIGIAFMLVGSNFAGGEFLPLWLCFLVVAIFAAFGTLLSYVSFKKSVA